MDDSNDEEGSDELWCEEEEISHNALVKVCSSPFVCYQEYIILQKSIKPPYYRSNNCSESNVTCT